MSFKFESNERKEIKLDNGEVIKLDIPDESSFDYNEIKAAEGKHPVHPENTYNSPEESEKINQPVSGFVKVEDSVGQTADDIIDPINENLELEKARLNIVDRYGFGDLIGKLFSSLRVKGNRKEMDDFIDRVSLFTKQHQKVLARHLPEAEEKARIDSVFKTIIGDVAYISDRSGEEDFNSERVELLSNYKKPSDARPGANRGRNIYYGGKGRSARGFLTQAEADDYKKKQEENKENHKENKKKSRTIFNKAKKEEIKAYNPLTKKIEKIG
jgi:hypothetical protein